MRLSAIWSVVHAWNLHRKHRRCMTAVPADIDILPSRCVYLHAECLALDFARAAAHGSLIPHPAHKEQPQ